MLCASEVEIFVTQEESKRRALRRAVEKDGRVAPVQGHVLTKDAKAVRAKMEKAAVIVQEIRDEIEATAPRPAKRGAQP